MLREVTFATEYVQSYSVTGSEIDGAISYGDEVLKECVTYVHRSKELRRAEEEWHLIQKHRDGRKEW